MTALLDRASLLVDPQAGFITGGRISWFHGHTHYQRHCCCFAAGKSIYAFLLPHGGGQEGGSPSGSQWPFPHFPGNPQGHPSQAQCHCHHLGLYSSILLGIRLLFQSPLLLPEHPKTEDSHLALLTGWGQGFRLRPAHNEWGLGQPAAVTPWPGGGCWHHPEGLHVASLCDR